MISGTQNRMNDKMGVYGMNTEFGRVHKDFFGLPNESLDISSAIASRLVVLLFPADLSICCMVPY